MKLRCEMAKVYLCICGDSVDNSVIGVFNNRQLAELFCAKFDECIVVEKSANPFINELILNYSPYFVRMATNGDVLDLESEPSCHGFECGENSHGVDRFNNMTFYCMASSKEHAIQLAREALKLNVSVI